MPFDQGAADELDSKDISPSSVSTEDLAVGSGDPVSGGPFGDTDEWVPMLTYKPTQSRIDTTQTSYSSGGIEGNPQSAFIPVANLSGITNVKSIGLNWAGYVKNDTAGESVHVSYGYDFNRLDGTEMSMTGDSPEKLESPIASIDDAGEGRTNVFMKVSGGTGSIEASHSVTIWGKIK